MRHFWFPHTLWNIVASILHFYSTTSVGLLGEGFPIFACIGSHFFVASVLNFIINSSLFVWYIFRTLGMEAEVTLKRIASCLADKWRQTCSRTCRYVKIRVTIMMVQTNLLLYPGLKDAHNPYHHVEATLWGWVRDKPFQVKNRRKTKRHGHGLSVPFCFPVIFYLKRFIPDPSSQCGLYMMIWIVGILEPRIQ